MTAEGQEIELKLTCAPQDIERVLAAAPAGEDRRRELTSVYFDTPDGALRRKGVSLRVRESEDRRVQTLKRGQGLRREEHQAPIEGRAPDPRVGPLARLLPEGGAEALRPAFNVRVTRRQRLLRYQESTIELAFDEGEVRGGGRARPISEVELELKDGRASDLFDLARELGRAAPLYLSFDGKAARGQALADGAGPAPPPAPPELAKDATSAAALQAIGRAALAQIATTAERLREAPDTEAFHALRVAARRLRSALSVFAPLAGDVARLKDGLRWLAHATNPVRDLDVFIGQTLAPAVEADPPLAGGVFLRRALAAARARAAAEAVEAIRSERFRALAIDLAAWLETGGWLEAPETEAQRRRPAREVAGEILSQGRRKLLKRGRRLARLEAGARHKVRIQAKKLRYAAEGLAPLFPARRTRRFVKRLKAVQDDLGALNDQAQAEALAGRLSLDQPAALAMGRLLGAADGHAGRRLAKAVRSLERLAGTEPFWE